MPVRKKLHQPFLGNVLTLFKKRVNEFEGESRRSYLKAFSSLRIYTVSNYSPSVNFDISIIENWVIDNLIHGLSINTVSFYLDKISSLYSACASKLKGGRMVDFKCVKLRLKEINPKINYNGLIRATSHKLQLLYKKRLNDGKSSNLLEHILGFGQSGDHPKESINFYWACLALEAGTYPNIVRGIIKQVPSNLKILDIAEDNYIDPHIKEKVFRKINLYLKKEETEWFAMRLRPKVKFDALIERFSLISENVKIPELFYPHKEIAKKVGRKIVWKGKPIIHDIVFFKTPKSEIYPLFSMIYDLAWCYRKSGGNNCNYASIPAHDMENFMQAIGILTPEFEVAPLGKLDLKPGDKVVILAGDFSGEKAQIIKKADINEDGNKIFRVSLLNINGNWNIGIDARLLKKD